MPIAISCDSCGKQLRAKDESAGKKIKCPGCGNVLAVPQSEEMTEEMGMEETAAPAPPPAPPAKITVACGCGKKLQVKAELAGKAVKCPGCQKVLKVPMPASNGTPASAPAPAAKKSAPPAKKPTPPPADDDNDFSFSKAPLPKAGKKTPARMPDEQEEDDDFGFTAKPKSKKAVSRPLDDDNDDEGDMDEDFRVPPRAKPQKSSKGMFILLVVLLLVVGLGVAGYFLYPMFFGDNKGNNVAVNNPTPNSKGGNPIPTPVTPGTPGTGTPGTGTPVTTPPIPPVAKSATRDFDLIARDAMGFATVRVGAYLGSDEGKRLRESKVGAKLKEGEDFLGIPFEDIERVSLVVLQPDNKRVYAVVRGKKPFDLAKFAAKNMAQSTKVGDKELLLSPEGGSILKLDEELLLMGKPEILQELAQKAPAKQGPLEARVKEAQDSIAPIFVTVGAAGKSAVPEPFANEAKDVQGLVFTLAEGADDIDLNASIEFASEDQAKAMLEKGKDLLGQAEKRLSDLASAPFVPAEIKAFFPKIQESLRDLELNTQDNKLTIAFKLSGVNITSVAEAALATSPVGASKENMHKLIQGMRVHDAAKNAWPDSLDQLEEHVGGKDELAKLLMNPLTGDNPGYEYVKPKGEDVGGQVVLYQLRGGKRDLKLPVGYGDTAVRMIDPAATPGAQEKKPSLNSEEKKPAPAVPPSEVEKKLGLPPLPVPPEEKKAELPPLPVPPEEKKKPLDPEEKKAELPPLPVLPEEKKPALPPLPVPPEKKSDLPGLPVPPEQKLDLPGLPLPPEKKLIVPLPPEPDVPPEKKSDVPPPVVPPEKKLEVPPPLAPEKTPDVPPPVLPPEKNEVKPALPPLPVPPPPEKKVEEQKLTVTPPVLEKQ